MDLRSRRGLPALSPAETIVARTPGDSYETAPDLKEIIMRQLNEDVAAYRYDMEYCQSQLSQPDISPQETRTLQLRTLDLGHQIRHCKHRIEIEDFHRDKDNKPSKCRPSASETEAPVRKRARTKGPKTEPAYPATTPTPTQVLTPATDAGPTSPEPPQRSTTVQRLGFWECRLCTSDTYLSAGPGRLPSAPVQWPLKDISKMISHHLDMHTEHSTEQRCRELGDALESNKGPFEYWLSRTKAHKMGDGSVIEECIVELREGKLPGVLRRLHRAAAGFPS